MRVIFAEICVVIDDDDDVDPSEAPGGGTDPPGNLIERLCREMVSGRDSVPWSNRNGTHVA